MRIPIALGAVAVLSACASSPNDISTAYVSELIYKDYSCEQVEMERTRVSQRADNLHASLKKTADNDTAKMPSRYPYCEEHLRRSLTEAGWRRMLLSVGRDPEN